MGAGNGGELVIDFEGHGLAELIWLFDGEELVRVMKGEPRWW
jgi:hypothetical protein